MNKKKVPQQMLPRGFLGWIMGWIMPIFHSSIYKHLYPLLDLNPGDDLLDIGCGSGYFLKKYGKSVRSITGLDLSEVMIKIAKKKNKKRIAAGTAEFFQGDSSRLPWKDNKFSVVTSMGSFIAFSKPLESIKEIHRVLRPGGRAVISIEWNSEDGIDHSEKEKNWGIKILSEKDVRSMMEEAEFTDISINYIKDWGISKMMIVLAVKQE